RAGAVFSGWPTAEAHSSEGFAVPDGAVCRHHFRVRRGKWASEGAETERPFGRIYVPTAIRFRCEWTVRKMAPPWDDEEESKRGFSNEVHEHLRVITYRDHAASDRGEEI